MQPGNPHGGHPFAQLQHGWFPARVAGDALVVPLANAQLPPICCKCGTGADVRGRFHKFTWTPVLAYVGLLLGVLPGVLVVLAMQKSAALVLPICAPCDARWSQATTRRSLAVAAPFVLAPIAALVTLVVDGGERTAWFFAGLGVFIALLSLPVLARIKYMLPRTMSATKIDDSAAHLRGASPALLGAVSPP